MLKICIVDNLIIDKYVFKFSFCDFKNNEKILYFF